MSHLIFPSARVLEHSFPQSSEELKIALSSLGTLLELRDRGQVIICLPDSFSLIVEDATELFSLVSALHRDIYRVYAELFLRGGAGVLRIMSGNTRGSVHPVTQGIRANEYVEIWRQTMGDLLSDHAQCEDGTYCCCAAVADDFAMAEIGVEAYVEPFAKAFVLAGPKLDNVAKAFEEDIPNNAHNLGVRIRDIKSNYKHINAISCGFGTNHYELTFASGSKWMYQQHCGEPIDDYFLSQLEEHTGMTLDAIKVALRYGITVERRPIQCLRPLFL